MSASWFKSKARNGLFTGSIFLLIGFFAFVLFDEKIEKIGIVVMTVGVLIIGMAYTAHIAYKQKMGT